MWPVTQSTVRTYLTIFSTPLFDQCLGFLEFGEDFPIQKLISQLAVKRFYITFSRGLPGSMKSIKDQVIFLAFKDNIVAAFNKLVEYIKLAENL
jgi:hypothetical protein